MLLLIAAVLFVAGCEPSSEPETSSVDLGPPIVARIGERTITLPELQAEVTRAQGQVEPEAVLGRMLRAEAILARAEKEGIMADPEVQRRINRLLIGELKKRVLTPRMDAVNLTDEELAMAYEERTDIFRKPEQRHLAIVYARNGEGQAQKRVAAAVASVGNVPVEKGFGKHALTSSDEKRSRYRGGDIGWTTRKNFPSTVPAPLIEIGYDRLTTQGQVSEPVQLDDGWAAVRLVEIRPETMPSFESIKPQLNALLLKEKREAVDASFHEETAALAPVEIVMPEWVGQIELNSVKSEEPLEPPSLP
ncbi:peptidylprolyl isomerase [Rubellicoccus peritrichatus]|uniref:peptidylprolyl isomerase n=1 Tax=Rubellicoccus peritrichatus TaxID=3080537 RepID=A0AAQ3LAZ8_9BACT|nr:peptidyl-prolyl cis-trans isomerase [Puniceicoccus sp. CR14]WOO40600.1 peptidyl-prolyl cis-trans isomerase [Puniceicoccus sp. CR14]